MALLGVIFIGACTITPKTQSSIIAPSDTVQVKSTRLTALLEGELTWDGKCLRIAVSNGESPLIVWPPDFSATLQKNTNSVQVTEGKVTGNPTEYNLYIGKNIAIAGGYQGGVSDPAEFQLSSPDCAGPYWGYAGLSGP